MFADGRMFLLPVPFPALPGRVLRAGVELGKAEKKRFLPAHALAMAAKTADVARVAALDDAQCARWLRGETLPSDVGDGWGVAAWRGHPLSLMKAVQGTLKNHYPKGLREH